MHGSIEPTTAVSAGSVGSPWELDDHRWSVDLVVNRLWQSRASNMTKVELIFTYRNIFGAEITLGHDAQSQLLS